MLNLKNVFVGVILLSSPCIARMDDGFEPPKNPFLADSPWPMTHRNPYCQASSPFAGPNPHGEVDRLPGLKRSVAVTLTLGPTSPTGNVIWASTHRHVTRLKQHEGDWKIAGELYYEDKPGSDISGAYTVLDHEGVFFTPHGPEIVAFAEKSAESGITLLRRFALPDKIALEDEAIIGLNLTYDGVLAFATNQGLVGVVQRDFKGFQSLRVGKDEEVSNSIAVDEDGGIFVVTSKNTHRFDWKNRKLTHAWKVPYQSTETVITGRLGLGSGTTPTLMGSGADDKLVVIADGQELMNIVAIWRDQIPADWKGLKGKDRRIAGEMPIKFGNPDSKRSVTEQSLLVRGYEAVAVNNDYASTRKGKLARYLAILNSNKSAPPGVEKFGWDPKTRTLKSVWANSEISCPNGIPTMSADSGLIYCVGAYEKNWTFEALDWKTGKHAWRKIMGPDRHFNSFYAAAEVGFDGDLLSGALAGFLWMR